MKAVKNWKKKSAAFKVIQNFAEDRNFSCYCNLQLTKNNNWGKRDAKLQSELKTSSNVSLVIKAYMVIALLPLKILWTHCIN